MLPSNTILPAPNRKGPQTGILPIYGILPAEMYGYHPTAEWTSDQPLPDPRQERFARIFAAPNASGIPTTLVTATKAAGYGRTYGSELIKHPHVVARVSFLRSLSSDIAEPRQAAMTQARRLDPMHREYVLASLRQIADACMERVYPDNRQREESSTGEDVSINDKVRSKRWKVSTSSKNTLGIADAGDMRDASMAVAALKLAGEYLRLWGPLAKAGARGEKGAVSLDLRQMSAGQLCDLMREIDAEMSRTRIDAKAGDQANEPATQPADDDPSGQ